MNIENNQNIIFHLGHKKDFKEFIRRNMNLNLLEDEKVITIFNYKDFLNKNKEKIISYDEKMEKVNNNINEVLKILQKGFFNQISNLVISNNILKTISLKEYLLLLTFIEYKGLNKNNFFIDYTTKKIKKNMFKEFYEKNKNMFEGEYNQENQKIFHIFINKLYSYIYFTNILNKEKQIDFRANVQLENLDIMFYLTNFPFGYLENNNVIKFLDIGYQTNISLMGKIKRMITNKIDKEPLLIEHFVEFQNLIQNVEINKLKNISPYFELYLDESNEDLLEYIKNYLDIVKKITYGKVGV